MIDPTIAAQIAMVAAASVVGAIVGGRRSSGYIARHADEQMKKLIEAQAMRIELLEVENARLREKILVLEGQVKALRDELDIEKRITARLDKEKA
ncbi:MAG: hypothetical protein RL646_1653 [Verrucomicrobiota bacterium]|jgi:hypothetical protein